MVASVKWLLVALYASFTASQRFLNPLEIVCYVNMQSDVNDRILGQLPNCSYIIVSCDNFFLDRASWILVGRNVITSIRGVAAHAEILLSMPLAKDLSKIHSQAGCDQLIQQTRANLGTGLFDGIDLDFDPTNLELFDQLHFARFLKMLAVRLGSSAVIATAIDCKPNISRSLVRTMNEYLDIIVLLPMSEALCNFRKDEVFIHRQYSESSINCALESGFRRDKIILGVQTAGIIIHSSSAKVDTVLLKNSKIGFISYGHVCQLHEQHNQLCFGKNENCPNFFNSSSKIIYDDPGTVSERAQQSIRRRLKGVSILLNYDDSTGLCGDGEFSLFKSVLNPFNEPKIVGVRHELSATGNINTDRMKHFQNYSTHEDPIARLNDAIENTKMVSSMVTKLADTMLETIRESVKLIASFVNYNNIYSVKPPGATSNESIGIEDIISILEDTENESMPKSNEEALDAAKLFPEEDEVTILNENIRPNQNRNESFNTSAKSDLKPIDNHSIDETITEDGPVNDEVIRLLPVEKIDTVSENQNKNNIDETITENGPANEEVIRLSPVETIDTVSENQNNNNDDTIIVYDPVNDEVIRSLPEEAVDIIPDDSVKESMENSLLFVNQDSDINIGVHDLLG
ncbi:uncharacterized protein LOC131438989 [Malaya genurostris]|uniref:uncharacterized protein LOC131438989 n=1 Tax=Malaya genurostris TaxID=325434 RepID=UPI0026F3C387|nr:uncharacterized protein LOC131438989 [Malaya genurostris]